MNIKYSLKYCEYDREFYRFPELEEEVLGRSLLEAIVSHERAEAGEWLDVTFSDAQLDHPVKWVSTDNFILHMRPSNSFESDPKAYVGRFSYEPESGELLAGRISSSHASLVYGIGSYSYSRYVRGIYIKEQKTVLLRPYFENEDENGIVNPYAEYDAGKDRDKTNKTIAMLVKNNLPSDVQVIIRANNDVVSKFDSIFV